MASEACRIDFHPQAARPTRKSASMDLNLKEKVAVVTGASQGLGKAIAFSLAKEGARVAISGRRQEVVEETAREIKDQTRADILPFAGDMTRAESGVEFIDRAAAKWGTIHILVNNVGQATRGDLESLDPADWQHAFDVNFMSAVHYTRQAIPWMKKQRWGRIINISALSGKEPAEDLIASNAVKSGMISFSKTLSRELAPHNILVNCVSPGLVQSPQNDRYFAREERKAAVQAIPLNRFGRPDEFADVVTFLCSDRAGYVTGVNLVVDGGASRGL